MDIRIDAAEGRAPPKDTFVSMRIGDFQKQSRFGSTKSFRFPQDKGINYARIEVFQRMGHLSISLDKLRDGELDIQVPVDFADMDYLPMRIGMQDGTYAEVKSSKAKSRLDAAQRYLAEHQLEEVIADAMREVIQDKPADPHSFLSKQIMKHAHGATKNPDFLPPIDRQLPPQPPSSQKNRKPNASEKLPPIGQSGVPAPEQDLADIREEARNTLIQSAKDGTLANALAGVSNDEMGDLRQEARQALIQSAKDGTLASALAGASKDGDLQKETAVALIRAAEDGSLDKALRETLGGSKDTELEDLREQARSTLLQGAKDGSLQAALKSTREDGKVEELRIQARDALLRASMSGALEKALGQGKTPKAAKATPAFQMEKPAFKFTPSVGSWLQRKPPQVEKPWYYTAVPVQAEDVKVVKDLQAVIAEKDHEIEALKAKLAAGGLNLGSAPALPPPAAKAQAEASAPMKSAPAPAKNKETSLANFRQYYVDQVLCTSALSSLEKLYSKFPAQPKPKPAPKPAASPVASAPRFALKPSVGTWLAPAPKKPSAAAAPPAASASAASATPFILKPSVGTWYMIKPFEERPKSVDILERTHSKLLTMDKEELITGFEKAIKKRDQEINNLKSTLKA